MLSSTRKSDQFLKVSNLNALGQWVYKFVFCDVVGIVEKQLHFQNTLRDAQRA